MLAGVLVGDRRLGGALGRLADEHGAGLGRGLHPRRGVDEVAGDHALALRAERDRRLAGEHAGARARAGRRLLAERGDRGDEVERGAHRPLGIVLLRDRRPPDGHDRVADELLDRAAVALDDLSGACRSSGTGARVSSSASRPSDAVVNPTRSANRHGHETPLCDGCGGCRRGAGCLGNRTDLERRPAVAAELLARRVRPPQEGQTATSAVPHSPQNFLPSGFSAPQFEQVITSRA